MIVLFRNSQSQVVEGLPCKQINVDLEGGLIKVWDSEGDHVVLDMGRAHFYAIRRQEDLGDESTHEEG